MNQELEQKLKDGIRDFRLPRYKEITDVGLFLDQTVRFINSCFEPFEDMRLTPSMVSNYVKQKLVEHPIKKMYGQNQIATLIFIAIAKTVLSLDDIRKILKLQRDAYPADIAYNCFCQELEQALQDVFQGKQPSMNSALDEPELKDMLHFTVITAAHRIHLEKFMQEIRRL